jgi:hypothetical protein
MRLRAQWSTRLRATRRASFSGFVDGVDAPLDLASRTPTRLPPQAGREACFAARRCRLPNTHMQGKLAVTID